MRNHSCLCIQADDLRASVRAPRTARKIYLDKSGRGKMLLVAFTIALSLVQPGASIYKVEQDVFKCLMRQQVSLIFTLRNLKSCGNVPYCVKNSFRHFPHTSCGFIHYVRNNKLITWSVQQHHNKILKWSAPVFFVVRDDVKCSVAMVTWKSRTESVAMCGYFLSWERLSRGQVVLQQEVNAEFLDKIHFVFFFESLPMKDYPRKTINLITHSLITSSQLIDSVYHNYFILGSNALQILILNITFLAFKDDKAGVMIYDGPSSAAPLLSRISKNDDFEEHRTSSFQALVSVLHRQSSGSPS